MKRRWIIVCSILLGLFLSGCMQESLPPTPEFVLTYAENQPEDYPTTRAAYYFAQLVEERTDGKVRIQVKHSGEYGTEEDVLNQMYFGGIDFARLSLAELSDELPLLNVLQLPYLYRDAEHMWRILDGSIGEEFLTHLTEIGLVGLSWYDAGARCFYSDLRPIRSIGDMEGLAVRVQESQMVMDMVSLLGGVPVTFAYSDVYYAFETNKIDAAENNWPSYQMSKHYEVAQYYVVNEHSRIPELQLVSEKTWNKLSEEYQTIVLECARDSARYQRELWQEQEEISRKQAISAGCQEILLTEEELFEFRDAVQPLYKKYCGDYMELIIKIRVS